MPASLPDNAQLSAWQMSPMCIIYTRMLFLPVLCLLQPASCADWELATRSTRGPGLKFGWITAFTYQVALCCAMRDKWYGASISTLHEKQPESGVLHCSDRLVAPTNPYTISAKQRDVHTL